MALSGCHGGAGEGSRQGAGLASANFVAPQLVRVQPELKGRRFSNLLQFEGADDLAFVAVDGLAAQMDREKHHTGASSLRVPAAVRRISVKLGSLMSGRDLPGDWSLAGAYVYADAPAEITVTCVRGPDGAAHTVELAPGHWTPVFADLDALRAHDGWPPGSATLEFAIRRPSGGGAGSPGTLWFDDVMLIDNAEWLLGTPGASSELTVRRRGFRMVVERPGAFGFVLDTADGSAEGWRVEELTPLRARFASDGPVHSLTVYRDGRSYWDGQYKPVDGADADNTALAASHASPAALSVPDELGRVNRSTPGDANNDGYNELSGAYELIATGPRLEVTLAPQSAPILHPVLEVTGLPPGRVLVTAEGQLIMESFRLPDGRLLVELPLRIERPTSVNIRID